MRAAKWAAIAGALVVATSAGAQTGAKGAGAYPNKPVRIIVPFSPGGATDIVTRIVAQKFTDAWGQTIVVDNRAGAGGNIGGEIAAKSNPDGYTLFMTSGSIVTANQHMYRKMPFNPDKDLVAITNVASGPQVLAVANVFPAKSVKELIALAKTKPGTITLGSAGIGTQTHLAAENFLYTAKIDAVHVPYKGEAPAVSDLVGGQIQMLTPNLAAAIGFIQQGRIRALAVTSKSRVAQLPNVPTVAETLPGFENLGWFGLMAPQGTSQAVIDKVHRDTAKVLAEADVRKRFDELGMSPVGNTPAAFAHGMREESARWAVVIRERNLTVN